GPVGDAWITALQFPNLFRRILAEGAFAQAFVPAYTRTKEDEGEATAAAVASETLSVLFTATIILSVAAQLAMPWIMLVLQNGYRDMPEIFELSILLTRITMPYLVGMALSALFSGVLNAAGKFALTAAAPTLLNICLLAAVMFVEEPRAAAFAASVAVAVAGFLQAGVLLIGVRRQGVDLRLALPRLTPPVKRVIAIAIPGALAASATQINIMISQSLASWEVGAKTWLAMADRLYQLPLGLVGVAVGVAILPRLSKAAADTGETADGARAMDEGVGLAMALTLPAAVALMVIPYFLVDVLFTRNAFLESDARMTAIALFHFGWGVPAFVLVKVLAPAFFARQDTVRPMRYAVASVILNTVFGAAAFLWLRSQGEPGFPGLAVATSLAAWLNVLLLAGSLARRGIYRPSGAVAVRLVRVALATFAMAAVLWFGNERRDEIEALVFGSKELALALVIPVAGLVYLVAAFLFRAVTVSDLRAGLRRS
ncbi:MAG: murein biosynthesis integral membrane protein MurJ, partial [Pseudomonadota bacterium]